MIRNLILSALLVPLGIAHADERLKGIACRSVHLGYPAAEGTSFYNEVSVEKSADGTYFMVCGWSKGYFGIQELANGKKLLLFSVWDPTSGDDPKKVKEEDRVKMLHKDDDVRVGRFGNEGTGGQSFFDYEWKLGQTYKFLVTATSDGEKRTAYSGYFFHPESKAWKHLVTFSTITNGKLLEGCYSFIEDFRRNKVSTTKERTAKFGNGWVKGRDGTWIALTKARFTADANPVENINAAVEGDRFLLATGGETKISGTKLKETLNRLPSGVVLPEDRK
ncbi:MAG: DUF3472 domain-containing protein [Gemmataceae bacterium]|nr:DUF3472 domain-containing protein [Gemmataceae bacterium]